MNISGKMVPFVIAVLIVAFLIPTPAFAASNIGIVDKIKSYAYGTPQGESKGALYANDDVFMQEVVETVSNGALHITFADDTVLRMGSASQVTLDQFVYNPGKGGGEMVARLGKGVFRFISGKMAKVGVKILTPTAIIGIRGTNFVVAVEEDGSTSVSVDEGEIEISSNEGSGAATTVSVGQIASVATSTSAVSISTGKSVSQDPGLSADAGGEGGGEGGGGGGGGGSH